MGTGPEKNSGDPPARQLRRPRNRDGRSGEAGAESKKPWTRCRRAHGQWSCLLKVSAPYQRPVFGRVGLTGFPLGAGSAGSDAGGVAADGVGMADGLGAATEGVGEGAGVGEGVGVVCGSLALA